METKTGKPRNPNYDFGGKIPPQDVELEKIVLGSMLLQPSVSDNVLSRLNTDSWYKEEHKHIFDGICAIIKEGAHPDILLLSAHLRKKGLLEICGGYYYISKLTDDISSTHNIDYHCAIIAQKALQRELIRKSMDVIKSAYEDSVDVFDLVDDLGQWYNGLNSNTFVTDEEITASSVEVEENNLITFKDKEFLSVGNISGIIAPYGTGKSNVMNAIIAGILNPKCDSLGFYGNLFGKQVLHIDTESSKNDAVRHYQRLMRRMGVFEMPELFDTVRNKIRNVTFKRYKGISQWKDRRREFEKQIRSERYKLALMDGLTDFMGDPNSLQESQDLLGMLGAMASKYEMGILCTIHDNVAPPTSDSSGRPRGHIGSELARKAEGLLYLRKSKQDSSIREITNDFQYQKLRNSSDAPCSHYMQWDLEKAMFVTTTLDAIPGEEDSVNLEKIILSIFKEFNRELGSGDLAKQIMIKSMCSEPTAKRKLSMALQLGIITKVKYGKYFLSSPIL